MTTTVIGATGRIGSAVVQRLLDAGHTVRALVRDPGKAGRLFGDVPAVEIVRVQLVTREWAIMAGENERTTTTVRDLTGHPPRTIEEFLHENRELFR